MPTRRPIVHKKNVSAQKKPPQPWALFEGMVLSWCAPKLPRHAREHSIKTLNDIGLMISLDGHISFPYVYDSMRLGASLSSHMHLALLWVNHGDWWVNNLVNRLSRFHLSCKYEIPSVWGLFFNFFFVQKKYYSRDTNRDANLRMGLEAYFQKACPSISRLRPWNRQITISLPIVHAFTNIRILFPDHRPIITCLTICLPVSPCLWTF